MKTGRYDVATQAAWDAIRVQILTAVQTLPHLTYVQVGQLFDCHSNTVALIARKAGIYRMGGRRKKHATAVVV